MSSKNFTITNDSGLHARPATILVKSLSKYPNTSEITFNQKTVDAKSIMGVMSLGVPKYGEVNITISNDDDNQIINHISSILKNENLID